MDIDDSNDRDDDDDDLIELARRTFKGSVDSKTTGQRNLIHHLNFNQ